MSVTQTTKLFAQTPEGLTDEVFCQTADCASTTEQQPTGSDDGNSISTTYLAVAGVVLALVIIGIVLLVKKLKKKK